MADHPWPRRGEALCAIRGRRGALGRFARAARTAGPMRGRAFGLMRCALVDTDRNVHLRGARQPGVHYQLRAADADWFHQRLLLHAVPGRPAVGYVAEAQGKDQRSRQSRYDPRLITMFPFRQVEISVCRFFMPVMIGFVLSPLYQGKHQPIH